MFLLVVLAYVLPGACVAAALRLRSWTFVAATPILTFGLVALGVPALGSLGIPWTLGSFAAWTLVSAAVLAALVTIVRRRSRASASDDASAAEESSPGGPRLTWQNNLLLAGGVCAGIGVGVVTFLRGVGRFDAINQDWDAPFHANVIRWISEHADALPSSLATIADSPNSANYFYPDTYHALLALLFAGDGAVMPQLLNSGALMTIIIWPVSVAACGIAWGLSPLLVAVAAAVSTWFGAFPYDSLWRGPLWPFVAGVALVPAVLAVTRLIVRPDRRAPLAGPIGAALAAAGLVGLHPSLAFVLGVYLLLLLVAVAFKFERTQWRSATRSLVGSALAAAAATGVVLLPSLSSAGGVLAAQWPQLSNSPEAFTQAAMFSSPDLNVQWYLGVPGIIGLAVLVARRQVVWIVGAYVFFAALYMAGAAYMLGPVQRLTGIFYTDVWRISALLPLAGALGIGALADWLARTTQGQIHKISRHAVVSGAGAVSAVVAFGLVLALATSGAYVERNSSRLAQNYHDGPTVSGGELAAMSWLAAKVEPGEHVLNDYQDGSLWMYAVDGVEPVKWTFNNVTQGTTAQYLLDNLNRLDSDPRVREAMKDVNARYVFVGAGTVRNDDLRSPGMIGLDSVSGLRPVFRDPDAVVYELAP